jgi:hypothetical protein
MSALPAKLKPLVSLVPPPPRPLRGADADNWDKLRAAIGFPFPTEFLHYGRVYGTGEIDAGGYALLIANPLDPAYPGWIEKQSEAMRARGDPPERRATRFYPEDGGVVPFGRDLSGDLLFFRSDRRAVRVTTNVGGDPDDLTAYQQGFTDFLVTLFAGKLEPAYFPNHEMLRRTPVFRKRAWLR